MLKLTARFGEHFSN